MILVWLAIAAVSGVLLGQMSETPPSEVSLAIALLFLLTFGAFRHRRRATLLLFAGAFCIGLARSPQTSTPTGSDAAFYNGQIVQLIGVVTVEPDIRDTGANYVISVQDLVRDNHSIPISGRVAVHTSRAIQIDYGDRVSFQGRLRTPSNTALLPWASILAHRGIRSEMNFPRLVDMGSASGGPLAWLNSFRRHIENGIDAWLPEPEAALLIAITLGAKSATLGDLARPLVDSGLIHLIAISGIKVALVAGIVYELARTAGNRILALGGGLAGIWVYVLLTGATASGERSALMWSLVFVAAYLGRGTVALVSLAFAAGLMVLLDPNLPWDTGFQLTVFGTFSIVAFASRFDDALRRLSISTSGPPVSGGDPSRRSVIHLIPSPFREALGVTLAAQIGTLPFVIAGFHVLSFGGPLANALALPLLPLLIVLGFLLGLVSGLPVLAAPIASFAYGLVHFVVVVARGLEAARNLDSLPAVGSFAYYLLFGIVAVLILRRFNWAPAGRVPTRAREFAFASILGACTVTASFVGFRVDTGTHLYWLGAGNAFLLRSGQQTALIDGSSHPFALLEHLGTVLRFSERTIDVLILTDPRASNASGVEELLRHYSVREVLDVGAEYPTSTYARWRADLDAKHVPVYALRTGALVRLGQSKIQALGPDAVCSNPADCVGLVKVETPHGSWLLIGRASVREQTEALFRPVDLQANALITLGKRPSAGFIRAVHASQVRGHWNPLPTEVEDLSRR